MDRIALADKLREKANVSYEEAMAALEASNWDLLDAIVLLEQQGKIRDTGYTTKREKPPEEKEKKKAKEKKPQGGDGFDKFMAFIGKILHKGNTNSIDVMRNGQRKFGMPVTVWVLILIFLPFTFWLVIPLLIISLFFGVSYKFVGPDLGRKDVNDAIEKAGAAATSMKDDIEKKVKKAVAEAEKEVDQAVEKAKKTAAEVAAEAARVAEKAAEAAERAAEAAEEAAEAAEEAAEEAAWAAEEEEDK